MKGFQVQCRGLPWECTESELKAFFDNSGIESVDIARRNGRASGDATVTFTNEDDYKKALKKDREHMGSRYIEVFSMDSAPPKRRDRDDFRGSRGGGAARDRHSDRFSDRGGGGGGSGGPDSVVRLRGLPFSVTTRDIADFLAPLPIVRDGILLPDQHRARPGGEAFVCFETMESVQIAKQRHMKNIGHRYIEVFDATHRELSRFADENGLRVPRFGPPPFVSGPPGGGPPRGAYDPYSQSQQNDSYRSDARGPGGGGGYRGAEPDDPYGRPRGAPSEYSRPSYDSYQQQQPVYGGGGGGGIGIGGGAAQGGPPASSGYYDNYAPKAAYDSYGRAPDPRDPRDSRGPMDPRDVGVGRDPRLSDPRGNDPRGSAPVDPYTGEPRYSDYGYDSRDSYWRGGNSGPPANNGSAVGGGGGPAGVPPAPVSRDPYAPVDSWASGGGAGGGGGPPPSDRDRYGAGGYASEPYGQREAGGPMRRTEYGRPDDRYAKPEPYGYGRGDRDYGGRPGGPPPPQSAQSQQFILRMRGIPFRATETDVHDFFAPVRPNQVELLRDSYQRLTGDARVIFYNRKDYDDALMKDKQYMGERYIEMIPDNGRY